MSAASAAKLYTPELLALAVDLTNYPVNPAHSLTAAARSRSCGSSLEISVSLDSDSRIDAVGMRVTACAVGQASAAIFAAAASGQTAGDIAASLNAIECWLAGQYPLPNWPGLAALEPARGYIGRHGAILLPWRAADAALCKPVRAG